MGLQLLLLVLCTGGGAGCEGDVHVASLLSLWLSVVMMVIIVVVCVFGGILNKVDIAIWWLLLFSPEKIRGTALL